MAGQAGNAGTNDGLGAGARFNHPCGLAMDSSDRLYVADWANHTIRRVNAQGEVVTWAGTGGISGANDGPGTVARFDHPSGVAVGPQGNLYVADTWNLAIRKITADGLVSTLLSGRRGELVDQPIAIAVNQSGEVYFAARKSIGKIGATGEVVTVVSGVGGYGEIEGSLGEAFTGWPVALAFDQDGNLLCVDGLLHSVGKISNTGMVVTRVSLVNPSGYWSDLNRLMDHPTWAVDMGSFWQMVGQVPFPLGFTVSRAGQVYIANNLLHSVSRLEPACPDRATIDSTYGVTGVPRRLDTLPQTAVAWRWSVIRRASGSTADLSDAGVGNPTFTPDVADLFVFQLMATNALGHRCVRTVELNAISPGVAVLFNPAYTSGVFSVSVPTVPGQAYVLEFKDTIEGGAWSALPSRMGDGTSIVLVDPNSPGQTRFYRVRLK
jgi:hypothetical protein